VKTRCPESATDWADSYSADVPSVGLALQDDEGSSEAEDWTGGGLHFTPEGTAGITFGVDGDGGRKAVEFPGGSAHLLCPDTDLGDVVTGPVSVWARVMMPAAFTNNAPFFGKRASGGGRWYTPCRELSNLATIGILTDDADAVGVQSFTLPAIAAIAEQWASVITTIDPNAGLYSIRAKVDGGPVLGGVAPWTPMEIVTGGGLSIGAHTSASVAVGYRCSYFAAWGQGKPALTDAQIDEILNASFDDETSHPFWTTIENAIHAWVVRGTGLAEAKVIWSGQNSPRPEGTHATLKIVAVNRNGPDWSDTVEDGDDVTFHSRGPREIVLSIQCFDGAATGALNSAARLDKTLALAALPTQQAAFQAAGVGYLRSGSVKHIGGVMGSVFEPRAQVDVTLSMFSDVSEPGSLIEFVEIENDGASIYVPSNPLA
jgi:hypothetical protein